MLRGALTIFLLVSLAGTAGCMAFQAERRADPVEAEGYMVVGKRRWRIRYHDRGPSRGPAVVLLHGYGSAGLVWLPLMKALDRSGYRAFAPDLPGFGLSDKRRWSYDVRDIADLVAAMMEEKGIERADLVAHSWGASVALALAARHPKRVKRLVLVGAWVYEAQVVPVLRWSRIPVVGEAIFWLFYRERPGEKYALAFYDPSRMVDQRVVDRIEGAFRRPGYLAASLAVARGMRFRKQERTYRGIKKPALLVWGRQDRVSLPFYGRRLASELKAATLVLIDRCGHLPMLERPVRFNRRVLEFLGPARSIGWSRLLKGGG